MTTDLATPTTRTVRPWFVLTVVAVAVLVIAGLSYHRWDHATIHGATTVFRRTSVDGVGIMVERGDVRIERTVCPQDGTWSTSCAKRAPGYAVRLNLAEGATGGTTLAEDLDAGAVLAPGLEAPAHVIVTAGLGIPPGSVDQQFVVVRTDPIVTRVRATHRDGSFDEMAPVDGLAVLATQTGWRSGSSIEAYDATGDPLTVN